VRRFTPFSVFNSANEAFPMMRFPINRPAKITFSVVLIKIGKDFTGIGGSQIRLQDKGQSLIRVIG
jgi:hypothetical protein